MRYAAACLPHSERRINRSDLAREHPSTIKAREARHTVWSCGALPSFILRPGKRSLFFFLVPSRAKAKDGTQPCERKKRKQKRQPRSSVQRHKRAGNIRKRAGNAPLPALFLLIIIDPHGIFCFRSIFVCRSCTETNCFIAPLCKLIIENGRNQRGTHNFCVAFRWFSGRTLVLFNDAVRTANDKISRQIVPILLFGDRVPFLHRSLIDDLFEFHAVVEGRTHQSAYI